jgi:hypothetical protein
MLVAVSYTTITGLKVIMFLVWEKVKNNGFYKKSMVYELEALEPLETRIIKHDSHMSDNNSKVKSFLLRGKFNTFLFGITDNSYTITTPFEDELKEPMRELVENSLEIIGPIDDLRLEGYKESVFNGREPFSYGQSRKVIQIYQTPLPSEEYESGLKRFKKTGYKFRELETNDVLQLIDLVDRWISSKKSRLIKLFDSKRIQLTIKELTKELEKLEYLKKERKYYEELFEQPLTHIYGTLKDDKLIAYLHIDGNNSFQSFQSRAADRINSYSPQEFLDLNVFIEFSKRRVPIIHRGFYNQRAGVEGLTVYKCKFGKLTYVREIDYSRVAKQKRKEEPLSVETLDIGGWDSL